MPIHEYGDEFYRPTNQAWQCPHCHTRLFTVDSIQSHKARCTKSPILPNSPKSKMEQDYDRRVQDSLKELHRKMGIK
jgi:hypothetical protein